ncbi:MAG: PhoU domain-containing protein [Gemmatimonadota bacterium]
MPLMLRFFRGEGTERLDRVGEQVQEMLARDRKEFDLAMSALLGEVSWDSVNDELRGLDREVNQLEREIRQQLLVHASVFGAIETPSVLVHMSVVKDIERVGDYAKNLLDLARDGASFAGLPNEAEWRILWWREVAEFITQSAEAFGKGDGGQCRSMLLRGDEILDLCDARVTALVRGEDTDPQPVARSLALRYLKRVVAHIMNLLSAVVMPFDQLDYFDEDPEDRRDRQARERQGK